ncbi:hypothetical protein GOBAR_AA33828 [Gossypium barbadense]|uniref:Transmembrane protein 135 N-terminal domain-containing protein n=1 Tax=Gossypium barbadense TaxID=3634 RepID=A0A2P5W6Y6_GOSBA|nr:hypothetical protein GOBAR_AA33828 [Gossypium barbadense]
MPLLSDNSTSSARLSAENAEAERRLREAEERLREAMEELHRRQRKAACGDSPPCDHADDSCVANAIGNLCQSFLLSYGVRVGIGILLRGFQLARGKSYSSLLDLKQLVSEKDLIVREEACRIGLLFGGFTGSYHALRCLLRKRRKKETPLNAILAGCIAGLSILALDDPNRRRTLSLYLLARVAQCAYNSAKSKNKFHLWGSHWRHGDSLLFFLACAQVMYAFVMRPESLPKSYKDFIQKTGPVAAPVYKAVRESCRGGPVDVESISAYLNSRGKSDTVKVEEFPSIIPCSIIHPDTNSCLGHNAKAVSATFRKTFPLYFSLTFVPFVVLHLQKFMDTPGRACWLAVKGAVQSTSFLSAFVGIFQAVICLHRKIALQDHKLVYWVAGAMSGLSVLLEKKARRGELALYVLPRAGESWWYILVNRHLLPDVKNAEVALFCACMGGIMYYLEYEPDTMAPFLRGLIRRFLTSRISNPGPSVSRTASYACLQNFEAMNKPKVQDNQQVVELLLENSSSGLLGANDVNESDLSALNMLLMFPSEGSHGEIMDILSGARALRERDISLSATPLEELNQNNSTRSVISKMHLAGWSIAGTSNGVSFSLFALFNLVGFGILLYTIKILARKFPLPFKLEMLGLTIRMINCFNYTHQESNIVYSNENPLHIGRNLTNHASHYYPNVCHIDLNLSLLQENPDLWKWLTGQEQPPEAVTVNPVRDDLKYKSFALEINAVNKTGFTALDVHQMFPSEAEPDHPRTRQRCQWLTDNLVEYFKFKKAFHVGLSPPGGTCQDSYFPNPNNGTSGGEAHIAGTSIMGTNSEVTFALFMVFNSMDFSMSLSMINILTSKFPLQFELQICLVALFFTYNTAMTCIAPSSIRDFTIIMKSVLSSIILTLTSAEKYCLGNYPQSSAWPAPSTHLSTLQTRA